MPQETQLSHFNVKVGGTQLPKETLDLMLDCTVENSLHLPDVCTLRLHDAEFRLIDADTFQEGKRLEIAGGDREPLLPLFDGEVADLELDLAAFGTPTLVVRAFDRSHRLHRGRASRSFIQMTDSDIVEKVGGEAGFTVKADATARVHDWVLQNNKTDWEFLTDRAQRNGFRLYVRNERELHFKKVRQEDADPVALEWGKDLRSFRPRVSAGQQVDEVVVRGWDPASKQSIVGVSKTPHGTPQIGGGPADGGRAARAAFGAAKMVVVDRPVHTQQEADDLARSVLDEIAGGFVEADGLCFGKPEMRAGSVVEVKNIGTRFSGRYHVTSVTHTYSPAEGYTTQFSVTGKRPATLLALLEGGGGTAGGGGGGGGNGRQGSGGGGGSQIVVGVVTDNDDPEQLGRVKVMYPWLTEDHTSYWARLASPMAGKDRGIFFVPEVDDEVLVALEHGEVSRPYVIGALWNGVDKPPKSLDGKTEYVDGGRVFRRMITSRNGNTIEIDDDHPVFQNAIIFKTMRGQNIRLSDKFHNIRIKTEKGHVIVLDDDADKIEIEDRTGRNKIVISTGGNSIEVTAAGPISMSAGGKVTIEGQQGVDIKSPLKVTVDGKAGTDVTSAALVNVQAPMVKIN